MTPLRTLDAATSVGGQLRPEDMAELKARGFDTVIHNRPDGEEPGQADAASLRAAAEAAGLGWHWIPMGSGGLSAEMVEATAAAMDGGRTAAFCRSGTRSTNLWALAEASRGAEADGLIAKAAAAGYDIAALRPLMERLRGAGRA